jgi:hypothetical protein
MRTAGVLAGCRAGVSPALVAAGRRHGSRRDGGGPATLRGPVISTLSGFADRVR